MGSAAVYFLPHVPKCAGSTIINHMRLHRDQVVIITEKSQRHSVDISERSTLENVRFFAGHYLPRTAVKIFLGQEIREIGLLRDPVGYFQSLYAFNIRTSARRDRAMTMDFDFWYRCHRKNPISHFLLSRYFRMPAVQELLMSQNQTLDFLSRQLDRFWFVGSYRHCNLLLDALSEEFQIGHAVEDKNVSRDNFVLSRRRRDMIRDDNRLDQALYEIWADRCWRGGNVARSAVGLSSWNRKMVDEASVCVARIERHLIA
ncbi:MULTISPECIES: sulfotransferase family 2 domain-containing protein [unclassified Beijerinckia]|uniref:sulfotransferase family 2 domain-containing protein n=1 Tax=unclassified Beijerinckia TaxID=2638183 RepID=UPI0008978163|nr:MULTISPECIES: sulfotransferase family 2 domain-containing protein [unclassified Beijerinckia]MDH7794243.1 hypothetical protein [Beijerinckia sp. GAS462]SEB56667.1 Sulfotransferase family protein [Beijerinckia sp. 28-YEA-48]